MSCNYSLTNSLLGNGFGVEWVILIFLVTIDWCGYSLVCTPFAGLTGADDLSVARGLSKECMAE